MKRVICKHFRRIENGAEDVSLVIYSFFEIMKFTNELFRQSPIYGYICPRTETNTNYFFLKKCHRRRMTAIGNVASFLLRDTIDGTGIDCYLQKVSVYIYIRYSNRPY